MSNILKLSQTYNFLLIKQFLSITFFLFFMYDQLQQINYNSTTTPKQHSTTLTTTNMVTPPKTKLWSHSYSTTTTTRATLKMIHSQQNILKNVLKLKKKQKQKIFKTKNQCCHSTKFNIEPIPAAIDLKIIWPIAINYR